MPQDFRAGDYLIFQIESGYGLLRILDIEPSADGNIWHLAAYEDLYLDVDMADAALDAGNPLGVRDEHLALTQRAFESTQVARMRNTPLIPDELSALERWRAGSREVSDRSVRLLLGLR